MRYISKYLFLFPVVLLFNYHLSAQSCLPDGIIFSTQEEIDNFAMDYAGCTQISGNVTIGNSDFPYAIQDLEGLNTLISIEGKLIIENNDSLRNLEGLDNIHTINGGLAIQFNYLLNSLYGLRNLSELNEDLLISVNDSLPDLVGLQGLSLVDGDLIIDNNDGLTSLNGLNNLTEIGGDFYVKYNDRLASFEGLEQLTLIYESCYFWYNVALVSIADLNSLNEVDLLSIIGNYNLLDITGLEGITSINSHLEIKYNNNLSDFSGLNNLTNIGGYLQIHNNAITDFTGFENLNTINEYMAVSENSNLLNFNGLDNLLTIGQHLFIGEHPNLISLNGLQNLTDINGYLWISNNPLLNNIRPIAQVNHTEVTDLRIYGNTNLGFCNTRSVCNYLSNNTRSATIYNNSTNCDAAETVNTRCFLPIELLTFRAYLENTQAILTWETATEVNNRGFEVQKSKDAINWEKIAWENGAGNSTIPLTYEYIDEQPFRGTSYYRLKQVDYNYEFEYSDIVNVNYTSENSTIIYPNPVKDILHINVENNSIQSIEIYDYTGKIILKNTNSNNIRVATLPEGIYAIKITTSSDYHQAKPLKNPYLCIPLIINH